MAQSLCSKLIGSHWNFTQFWNSKEFRVERGLERTWLIWIPCVIFLILLFFHLLTWFKRRRFESKGTQPISLCWFCWMKMISVGVIFLLSLIRLIGVPLIENNRYGCNDPVEFVSLVLATGSWLILAVLTYFERETRSFEDGAIQTATAAAFVICGIPEFVSSVGSSQAQGGQSGFAITLVVLSFITEILIAILFSISHGHHGKRQGLKEWPEKSSSYFSRLFFFFFWRILIKGYKKILSHDDLWELDDSEQCANICEIFTKWHTWAKVKFRRHPTLALLTAVVFTNWKLLLSTFFLVLVREIMAVIIILDIEWMLNFTLHRDEPRWHGWIYVAIASSALFVRGVCFQHKDFRMIKFSQRFRSAVSATVLKKSLAMSSDSRRKFSPGEVHNFAIIDASRMQEHVFVLHMVFSLPLQICIGAILLRRFIGTAFWAGIMIYLVCAFISLVAYQAYYHYFYQKCVLRDKRMRVLVETLTNMKLIKYYAWEEAFKEYILKVRRQENIKLRNTLIAKSPGEVLLICTMQLACLSLYSVHTIVQGRPITTRLIFVAAAIFRFSLCDYASINEAINLLMKVKISMKRLANFFAAEEIVDYVEKRPKDESDMSIVLIGGEFAWSVPAVFTLDRINLAIPRHQLVGVAGVVGSGKSSLISAIAGEMRMNTGCVKIYGTVAYVPQQAWILNDTLRGNILFGRPYEKEKYYRIVEACALLPDLEVLPAGHQTEIGERGVNLSGGQKQRISLARAVYQNCDIYLLDDPLSAVDVHVKEHLFENVIGPNGLLREKTRIFVTNAISYLPQCDRVILMENGKIAANGSYLAVAKDNTLLSSIKAAVAEPEPEPEAAPTPIISRKSSKAKSVAEIIEKPSLIKSKNVGKLIQKEIMEYGKVSWKAYWLYFRAGGLALLFCAIFILTAYSFDAVGMIWLRHWTANAEYRTNHHISDQRGIFVLGMLVLTQFFVATLFSICSVIFAIRTARILHDIMLMSILRAPITFFDTTPIGRILNRFGKEIHAVDLIMYVKITLLMHSLSSATVSIMPSLVATPLLAAFVFPAIIAFTFIQRFYIVSARQFQRLEAVTRSNIYSYIHDVLHGPGNIRIYGRVQDFIGKFDGMLNTNLRPQMMLLTSMQWLSMNLIVTFEIIVTSSVALALMSSEVPEGSAMLSIAFILGLSDTLMVGVRRISELEIQMIAVERIQQYLQIPSEAAWESEKNTHRRKAKKPKLKALYGTFTKGQSAVVRFGKSRRAEEQQHLLRHPDEEDRPTLAANQIPKSWPAVGRIEFINYGLRYRPELPLALDCLNLTIEGGQKVGIVGRTGAGKTSLTVGLFRLIEPASGTILIDEVDITTIGLHELRRVMTVIPQDPALFYGTLRLNMDPFDEYSDDQIWTALENSHLKNYVNSMPSGLSSKVEDGGGNMSVGQRQLVCLARALLRHSKILVLDEATACVDLETDRLIQSTIHTKFAHCTVITVAHRLETIMDYDRVALFENGTCVEFGSIKELLIDERGRFTQMVKAAGLAQRN